MNKERIQRLHKFMRDFKKFMRDNHYDIDDKDIQGYLRGLVRFNVNELKERIMDYEMKYKEALERARDFQHDNCWVTSIFPELKESKDEKIRKWLIRLISTNGYRELESDAMPCNRMDILSWLEKQKPAWSEEDEKHRNAAICACSYMIENFENSTKIYEDANDWLKSLKPQNHWKPSEEQISALEYQVNSTYIGSWQYKASKELLEQLKKL